MKIIRNKSNNNNNNNNNKMLTYSKNYIKKIIADNNSQRHCRNLIPYCDLRIVYLCESFFFNKVAGIRPATLLKSRL